MKREEQVLLLAAAAFLVVGGVIQVKFGGSGLLHPGGDRESATGVAKLVVNSALKNQLVNATPDSIKKNAGSWNSPHWKIETAPLRMNHPLYRRPCYIGEARHKVMNEGWGGWYYNPPSEDYF